MSTDAATVGQIDAVMSALGGGAMVQAGGGLVMPSYAIQGINYSSAGDALGALDNIVSGAISNITNLGNRTTLLENNSVTTPPSPGGSYSGIAIDGSDPASVVAGSSGVALGNNAQVGGDHGTAVGGDSYAAGPNDAAIGGNAKVNADGSTAVGANTTIAASATNAVAVGEGASVTAASGTAIGQGSSVTAEGAVALGQGSVADRANTVSVGAATNSRQITNVAAGTEGTDAVNVNQLQATQAGGVQYDRNTDGTVDYTNVTMNPGGDPTVIHNVEAGTADNDVANVGQLNAAVDKAVDWSKNYTDQRLNSLDSKVNTVGNRANGGIASAMAMAMAMAMASLPQAYQPNQSSAAVALGSFHGEAGIAVGMSTVTESGRYILKLNATTNTRGDAGVGVGAGMVW